MASIYVIINKLNNKMYVGKTTTTIERRFSEHKRTSLRDNIKNRPLYKAFNKYGFNNFEIKEIFSTKDTDLLEEKEIYFIKKLNTYKSGYNATIGGEGRSRLNINSEDVVDLYKKSKNLSFVGRRFNCDKNTIKNILNRKDIEIVTKPNTKGIKCLELNKEFNTRKEAAKFLIDNNYTKCKDNLMVRRLLSKYVNSGKKYLGLTWIKYTAEYQAWE